MSNELEINFLHNQINANNQIRSVSQHQIATLLNLVHQQRQFIEQLDNNDRELNLRLNSMNDTNTVIVKHENNHR